MKEYLVKQASGKYDLCETNAKPREDWIEIPSDAEYLTRVTDAQGMEWMLLWKGNSKIALGHENQWVGTVYDVHSYSSNWRGNGGIVWQRNEQPLAETLNERESTYGSFSNVAEMTQGLLFVMEQYGYKEMPDKHKEALHMICSKMARIVNGNHSHKDSWHDIGGYSALVERMCT